MAVVRMPKAYPVYDGDYKAALEVIRHFVDGLSNLQLVGRNGMHKYNNQDHSMLTAMLTVRNIVAGSNGSTTCGIPSTTPSTTRRAKPVCARRSAAQLVPQRIEGSAGGWRCA